MSFERISIFIEALFQFCFGRRGIVWQPVQRDAQAADADPLFQDIIGNAVLNTGIEYQQDVNQHSTALWNYISNLPVPLDYRPILHRTDIVAHNILADENYGSHTQGIYVFLAVMVEVATQAARNGNHLLVQNIARIVAFILHETIPHNFIPNFDLFLMYAFRRGQPPAN